MTFDILLSFHFCQLNYLYYLLYICLYWALVVAPVVRHIYIRPLDSWYWYRDEQPHSLGLGWFDWFLASENCWLN